MEGMNENGDYRAIRPKMITILCYITIFSSIYMMMTSISGLMEPANVVKSTDMATEIWEKTLDNLSVKDPDAAATVEKILADLHSANTTGNMRDHSFFMLVFNALTMAGAWLMMRLKRLGLRLYVLGNVIAIVSPLLVFGSDNLLGQAFSLFQGITGGMMILLYSLKIKYLI